MKGKVFCKECGNIVISELERGNVVTPKDGSSMCSTLHSILFRGPGMGFKPVRIIDIQGKMLAVEPAHWDDKDVRNKELWGDKFPYAHSASTWIWGSREHSNYKVLSEYGFWIDAYVSGIAIKEEA